MLTKIGIEVEFMGSKIKQMSRADRQDDDLCCCLGVAVHR